jgi:hypothetical protein
MGVSKVPPANACKPHPPPKTPAWFDVCESITRLARLHASLRFGSEAGAKAALLLSCLCIRLVLYLVVVCHAQAVPDPGRFLEVVALGEWQEETLGRESIVYSSFIKV